MNFFCFKLLYRIVTKPPIVNIDPEKQLVAQGSLAIIKCTSPSDPNKPITWHKVGENITSGVQVHNLK